MPAIPEESPSPVRDFAPVHSCGGLVAAVGLLLATGAGCVSTLPGIPTAGMYPLWAAWALRLAPLLAFGLLVAVVYESSYKVRAEPLALHFRRGIVGSARVPWREVTDYFADCGRSLTDMASAGGSLVHPADDPSPPFATYGPDYTVVSGRGVFTFSDNLADVGVLAAEVSRLAPADAPRRWEEASWLSCPRCGERTAVSLWPLPAGHRVWYCDRCHAPSVEAPGEPPPPHCACGGAFAQETLTCPTCGEPFGEEALAAPEGFFVEQRGAVRRPEVWPPTATEPVAAEEQPEPPPPETGEDDDENAVP